MMSGLGVMVGVNIDLLKYTVWLKAHMFVFDSDIIYNV